MKRPRIDVTLGELDPLPDQALQAPLSEPDGNRIKTTLHTLVEGDACPECPKGKVYGQKEPRPLVRVVGQAPLAATVYAREQLRCHACGQLFTAPAPEGVGPEKYDETASATIAQLKYGSGAPFNRIGDERTGVYTSALVSVARDGPGPERAPCGGWRCISAGASMRGRI